VAFTCGPSESELKKIIPHVLYDLGSNQLNLELLLNRCPCPPLPPEHKSQIIKTPVGGDLILSLFTWRDQRIVTSPRNVIATGSVTDTVT